MAVSDETLAAVRRSDRDAIETVINDCFPAVHRVAHALTGDPVIAGRVVRFVLRRGVSVMPRWRQGLIPENWFYHHTLLTLRRINVPAPTPERDLLVIAGPSADPAYVAFVRALRGLPNQQVEAYLLHHGEKLNERLLGVAMDLSTGAAGAHLAAATLTLHTMAGENYPALAATFEKAYASLTPPETIVRTTSRSEIRSILWRKLIRRVVRRLVLLAVLGGLAYAGWRWRAQLRQWFEVVRAAAQTRRS